jgi:hypothetical protein
MHALVWAAIRLRKVNPKDCHRHLGRKTIPHFHCEARRSGIIISTQAHLSTNRHLDRSAAGAWRRDPPRRQPPMRDIKSRLAAAS